MFGKMKFKMFAIFGMFTLVVPMAIAQDAPPFDRDELPPLRTPVLHAQLNSGAQPMLNARRATSEDDVSRVLPKPCKKREGKFPFKFDKVKVADMVENISQLTCRNFILAADVVGNKIITVISRTPVDIDQAWQVFLSSLEINNLTVVQAGAYTRIETKSEAGKQNIPIFENGDAIPSDDGMVTMLYDVQSMSNTDIQRIVQSLVKTTGGMGNVPQVLGSSYVLFSESARNVKRILKILEKIDLPGSATQVHIKELKYAKAVEVESKLNDIFDSRGSSDRNRFNNGPFRSNQAFRGQDNRADTSQQKIISDERTNKLIIIASDKTFERIAEMIEYLDVEASGASTQGQIFVYTLKNGDAEKLSTTLSTLVSGAQTNVQNPRQPFPPLQGDSKVLFEGDIKVTFDKATNSLIVVASPRDYKTVREVIERLDKPRTQVYVEAAIMDIGITDQTDLGLNLYAGLKIPLPGLPDGGLGVFGNPGGIGIAKEVAGLVGAASRLTTGANAAAAAIPSFLGTFGLMGLGSIPLPGGGSFTIPSVGFLLKALQESSNVDVLSTPSIMTLDNEKASITVGERIPTLQFTSNVASGTAGGGISVPSIKYEDVKLKFEITPHVNGDNKVKLEIVQDVDELGGAIPLNGTNYNRIRTKNAATVVTAKDQETIVIGGLISERTELTESKVPLLGDLPIIGYLFKNTVTKKTKANLVLVLTPYIIRSDDDLRKIHDRKLKERDDFAKLYFGDKITRYDPKIDYSKKAGPLTQIIREVELEMMRVQNGGPGLPDEVVIGPRSQQQSGDAKIDISLPLTSSPDDFAPPQYFPPQFNPQTPFVDPGFVEQMPVAPEAPEGQAAPGGANVQPNDGVSPPNDGNIPPSPAQLPPASNY